MTIFNYVIVGSGPAGLSASYGLNAHHETNYLLIDSGDGLSERVQSNDKTHIGGIGGAGLFSDGYFVFYPAGNRLWLLDQECLRESYNQLAKMFQGILDIPAFPRDLSIKSAGQVTTVNTILGCHADMVLDVATSLAAWFGNIQNSDEQTIINTEKRKQKKQSTFRLTLEQRTALIASILHGLKPNQLSLNTKLCQIESTTDNTYILHCKKNGNDVEFRCKNIILSGGRFFPIVSQSFPMIKHVFKQVEIGVRLCGPANNSLFSDATQANSKIIPTADANLEYRTFFWCRNGGCSWAEQDGIAAYYGSSECPATSESNFGFNVCYKSDDAQKLLEKVKGTRPFELSLAELDKLHDIYDDVGTHIATGIELFFTKFSKDTNLDRQSFMLKGPTLEAVGNYPLLDQNMKVPGENIWYAGDATGVFRGIIPSMLSGLFVVNQTKKLV
ncbi:unnamed protein product [Rotaria socialis]|uniref:Uncharacterized protein n=2 Tax=Rotaria socialis TaxID=392032 RepID=A0A818G3G1_9BILA|nr:unnamed protein product [Rotaria socialis]CAF3654732.1 unnamed protein product [Rotaria socialis]CAF4327529.1 unnamed protein product [Rotaria socialis]CAF4824216.1 unnamed protein product [Rotaria socialis]